MSAMAAPAKRCRRGSRSRFLRTLQALEPLELADTLKVPVFNLRQREGEDGLKDMLETYYALCTTQKGLFVTTSCYSQWDQDNRVNSSAKVIPAVPSSQKGGYRVFFFDDNVKLNLGSGAGSASGICNLRDVTTGQYVDFGQGQNGFTCSRVRRHTLVHYSQTYSNVIVQANLLEAIANPDYFTRILEDFSEPGEKLIVHMDVNGTILGSDSANGVGSATMLLSLLAERIQVIMPQTVELEWQEVKQVLKEGCMDFKDILHPVAEAKKGNKKTKQAMHALLEVATVVDLMHALQRVGAVLRWGTSEEQFDVASFVSEYHKCLEAIEANQDGEFLAESWFTCLKYLQQRNHLVVLNSFGMDTEVVLRRSAAHPERLLRIAVNYELWGDRDKSMYLSQFPVCGGCQRYSCKGHGHLCGRCSPSE